MAIATEETKKKEEGNGGGMPPPHTSSKGASPSLKPLSVNADDDLPNDPEGDGMTKQSQPGRPSETSVPRGRPLRMSEAEEAEMADTRRKDDTKLDAARMRKRLQKDAEFSAQILRSRPLYNGKVSHANELVLIRSIKTHSPPPTIGAFKFMDHYRHYEDGVKYLVPRYVAQSLDETSNAIMLEE